MVFGELTALFPLLASDAFHRAEWKKRRAFKFADMFEKGSGVPGSAAGQKKKAGAR